MKSDIFVGAIVAKCKGFSCVISMDNHHKDVDIAISNNSSVSPKYGYDMYEGTLSPGLSGLNILV